MVGMMTEAQGAVAEKLMSGSADLQQAAAAEIRRIADQLINGLRVRGFCKATVSTSALRAAGAF